MHSENALRYELFKTSFCLIQVVFSTDWTVLYFIVGAAYSRCENELKKLVEGSGLPFLPTPMGKGTLPDDHKLCVAPARSK